MHQVQRGDIAGLIHQCSVLFARGVFVVLCLVSFQRGGGWRVKKANDKFNRMDKGGFLNFFFF